MRFESGHQITMLELFLVMKHTYDGISLWQKITGYDRGFEAIEKTRAGDLIVTAISGMLRDRKSRDQDRRVHLIVVRSSRISHCITFFTPKAQI
jgi:hypothetical protein